MDFQLSADQEALRAGIRAYCEDRFAFEHIKEFTQAAHVQSAAPQNTTRTREVWRELAEMGVFALRQPESAGGVGLGMADAAVVFCELGRRLAPGPLLWSHLAAGLVTGAATGERMVGGLALAPAPAHDGGAGAGDAHAADGATFIEHGAELDALLLLRADGVYLAEPPTGELVAEPLDPATPVTRVAKLPTGKKVGDAADAARLQREGMTLAAALLLGLAERALEYAVEYAKGREQFGRAIASFQAIKHLAADMYVQSELARAATLAAAVTLDDESVGDPARATATAQVVASAAALHNARKCIQIYGGMGFTWEMPPHYYLKRAMVLTRTFGENAAHCEHVAARL